MHPSGRPLHLLLLCEALCDDLFDGRFHEGGRDRFAISSSLSIVRDHAGIGADIAFELPQMLVEIASLRRDRWVAHRLVGDIRICRTKTSCPVGSKIGQAMDPVARPEEKP